MSGDILLELGLEAIILVVILSAPPVILATAIGLFLSILQALTQIQDQTIPFAGKLFGVAAIFYGFINWYGSRLTIFASEVFQNFNF